MGFEVGFGRDQIILRFCVLATPHEPECARQHRPLEEAVGARSHYK